MIGFGLALQRDNPGRNERGDLLNIFYRFAIALLLMGIPAARAVPALAQEGGTLIISAPDTRFFPTINFQMDAYDGQGHFLDNLKGEDIEIVENGQALKPAGLETVQNGLQVIVALNTSPWMATPNKGVTGYEVIQKAVSDWAATQPATTLDDFSLSTPTGLFLIRERNPNQLVKAITEYKPDLLHTQPGFGSLAESLDLATDPLDRAFMKRVILYITPPVADTAKATLDDLIQRAKGTGARVNVLAIVPSNNTAQPGELQKLAQVTGGQYIEVAPGTEMPDLEPLVQPMRRTYQVRYNSTIQKSGSNQVSVRISGSQQFVSNEIDFNLTVKPPNPIFLSPPTSIQRTWVKSAAGQASVAAQPNEVLAPDVVPLQILIEFPDQHRRTLQATRLYVNGKMVQENTGEPFDRFSWSLTDLTTPTKAMLRVEAVDTLGLTGGSIEVPVDILVDQRTRASLAQRISENGMIALGAMLGAGAVLALVLTSRQRRLRGRRSTGEKKLAKDPLTQPVSIRQEPDSKKRAKTPAQHQAHSWPGQLWNKAAQQSAPARLVVLDENEQPVTGATIFLTRQEITFGKDPQRATQVLDSPTVDGLHARLYREQDGSFHLADQNSVAGTWINYAPVTEAGARLEHGDLIHIGKMMFRFELADPASASAAKIQVIDLES